jgi:hypothetical protein
VTNSYDGSPSPACTGIGGLQLSQVQSMHDNSNYGTGFPYRGNLTQTTGLIAGNKQCYAYDTAGCGGDTWSGASLISLTSPEVTAHLTSRRPFSGSARATRATSQNTGGV